MPAEPSDLDALENDAFILEGGPYRERTKSFASPRKIKQIRKGFRRRGSDMRMDREISHRKEKNS